MYFGFFVVETSQTLCCFFQIRSVVRHHFAQHGNLTA